MKEVRLLDLAKTIIATLLIGFACNASLKSFAQPPADVSVRRDISYTTVAGRPLHLDLFRLTAASSPLPVVVCIHGGGWASGNKSDMSEIATGLAKLGYCAIPVEYRLAPGDRFPAAFTDIKTAIFYIRQHAGELKIDPQRIGVLGSSAGAHLALLLATTDLNLDLIRSTTSANNAAVRAAVSIAGPVDLTANFPQASEGVIQNFLGKSRRESLELFKQASPIYHVTSNTPPLLLIHGDKDEIVPYIQAVSMQSACKRVGVPAEIFTLHNAGHAGGGDPREAEASVHVMAEFLAKYLK